MNRVLKSIFSGILFFQIFHVYAAANPTNVKISDAKNTSVMLSWDAVTDAQGYYLYYGTKSGVGGSYEKEVFDIITHTNYTLENLKENTQYFFAVSSVDALGEESGKSTEVTYTTLASSQAGVDFRIESIEVVSPTQLEVRFSRNLENTMAASRIVMLEKKSTNQMIDTDTLKINTENPKILDITLQSSLQEDTDYDFTIVDIRDENGNTIESGINAFLTLHTPTTFSSDNQEPENLNSAGEQETPIVVDPTPVETPDTSSESTDIQDTNSQSYAGNGGTNFTKEVVPNINQTAQETEKLPDTGPAEWILGLIALMLSSMILLRKKVLG